MAACFLDAPGLLLLSVMMLPLLCCPTSNLFSRSRSKKQRSGASTGVNMSSRPAATTRSSRRASSTQSQEGLVLVDRPKTAATTPSTAYAGLSPALRPGLTPDITRQSSILWTKPLPQVPPSDMALSGKIALVTGGSRGIGAAIALKLATEGARIAFTFSKASSVPKAHAVIAAIEAAGSSATAIQADVTKDPERVVRHALKAFGVEHLDILVNNAGVVALDTPLAETTPEAYDRIFDVNTRSVFFAMRAAAPYLAENGRVINVSAAAARDAEAGSMAFAGSKAAIEAFSRVAAREMGEMGRGITVNCVSPGVVQTDDDDDDIQGGQEGVKGTPAGARLGTPADVADVVAFVAGSGARWITGAVLPVNGGKVMV